MGFNSGFKGLKKVDRIHASLYVLGGGVVSVWARAQSLVCLMWRLCDIALT